MMSDFQSETRIYLDHAATSWPKPASVIEAISTFVRECGASAGRGNYRSAMQASAIVHQVRRQLARLISAESDECLSLHGSGTAALNAAIHGLVRRGDHVVVTAAEHNSVLRPFHHLSETMGVQLEVVPVDQSGRVNAMDVLAAVKSTTRMVAVTGASNVTGAIQPILEIGEGLEGRDTVFLCDAAQTFGLVPIDVQSQKIDVLAAPGHKGSLGPAGTAMLYVTETLHDELVPSIQGGTGSLSESMTMPIQMPEKLEAGTFNVGLLSGWLAALSLLAKTDLLSKQATLASLAAHMHQKIAAIDGINVLGDTCELPIVSITMDALAPADLATILDQEFGIETRSGFHCAAAIHGCLGSEVQGTLRISAGCDTEFNEIDGLAAALASIATTMKTV